MGVSAKRSRRHRRRSIRPTWSRRSHPGRIDGGKIAARAVGAVGSVRLKWSLERRLSRISGLLLAAHFATWVPSLSFTSVASSVALVATQPVWAAIIARWRGDVVFSVVWPLDFDLGRP